MTKLRQQAIRWVLRRTKARRRTPAAVEQLPLFPLDEFPASSAPGRIAAPWSGSAIDSPGSEVASWQMRGVGLGVVAVVAMAAFAEHRMSVQRNDAAGTSASVSTESELRDHAGSGPFAPRKTTLRSRAAIASHVTHTAKRYGVPERLVTAVITAESEFNPRAVSRAGATGLMQLMPRTAALLGVDDMFDPLQNVDGGVRHLRQLMDRFDGNLPLVLAAYNAGEQAVIEHRGVPPYPETRKFVARVLRLLGASATAVSTPDVRSGTKKSAVPRSRPAPTEPIHIAVVPAVPPTGLMAPEPVSIPREVFAPAAVRHPLGDDGVAARPGAIPAAPPAAPGMPGTGAGTLFSKLRERISHRTPTDAGDSRGETTDASLQAP